MVGIKIKLDTMEWAKGVFGIVILLKKLKKFPKLGRRNRALGGLGKVGFGVPSIQEGLYPRKGIVDTFKDRIWKILVRTCFRNI